MAKKNTPPPQPQQSLHELSLTVLDLDLRTIAQNDPDMIHQCLHVHRSPVPTHPTSCDVRVPKQDQ